MTPEQQIDAITYGVCEQFARDVIDDLQQRLSDAYPPSSDPGTEPHRRTGDLRAGLVFEIYQYGPLTQLAITSTMPYSAPLEFGSSRGLAPRPFMQPALERWMPVLIERLQQAFSGPSPINTAAGAILPTESIAA